MATRESTRRPTQEKRCFGSGANNVMAWRILYEFVGIVVFELFEKLEQPPSLQLSFVRDVQPSGTPWGMLVPEEELA